MEPSDQACQADMLGPHTGGRVRRNLEVASLLPHSYFAFHWLGGPYSYINLRECIFWPST